MMDLFGPIFRAEARIVGVENIPTTPVTLLESLFPGLGNCLQIKLPPGDFFLSRMGEKADDQVVNTRNIYGIYYPDSIRVSFFT